MIKVRIVVLLFTLALFAVAFHGCRSQEICPAYSDAVIELEELSDKNG